ncbi:hypothetical protein K443DRAFT_11922 [Laccaria amethystina LaAM-08-1]|uniref:Uncharacterized protein n=1 Tax=Laccaria amethystina LaAM-08-1 TaxID=1095629 RepID=A0A0C9XET9_9AGAR|nr:hypothetical protein K443DRAFT_11922 [Laccaria amethystina LaAM-08-1]
MSTVPSGRATTTTNDNGGEVREETQRRTVGDVAHEWLQTTNDKGRQRRTTTNNRCHRHHDPSHLRLDPPGHLRDKKHPGAM